jgi:hypothetical protein
MLVLAESMLSTRIRFEKITVFNQSTSKRVIKTNAPVGITVRVCFNVDVLD